METEKNRCSSIAGAGGQAAPAPDAPARLEPAADEAPPLSTGDYIVMFVLFSLPVINLIIALVWGFGSGINPNRKNFAKAWLVMLLIALIAGIMMGLAAALLARNLMPVLQEFFEGFQL